MHIGRRELLAGVTVGLAGCARVEDFLENATPPDGHPLAGTTAVAIRNQSTSNHDLERLVDESLSFWTENAEQYAGFAVEFERTADEQDADVLITFLETRQQFQGCHENSAEEVLGCAPLIHEGTRISRPVVAEVVSTDRPYGDVRVTTQHEIGHLLGLTHDDAPAYIMSNRIEDRLPEYNSRIAVVEAYEAVWETRNDGTRTYNDGIRLWNDREFAAAVSPFERAADIYRSIFDHIETAESEAEAFEDMSLPETVNRERLAGYFETARHLTELSIEAADDMATASTAAADGDTRTARERQETAEETLAEFQAIDAPTPTDVASAVGLIRDPDEDQPGPNPGSP